MFKYIQLVSAVWFIIVGGLLIFLPHGPVICIACGAKQTLGFGIISIVLGVINLVGGFRSPVRSQ
jgi:hypothetical protein